METGQQEESELESTDVTKWIEKSLSHLASCLEKGGNASDLENWPSVPDVLKKEDEYSTRKKEDACTSQKKENGFSTTIESIISKWDDYWKSCIEFRRIDVQKAIIQIEKLTAKSFSTNLKCIPRKNYHKGMLKDPVFIAIEDIWNKLSNGLPFTDAKPEESTSTEYSCFNMWFLECLKYFETVLKSEAYFVEDLIPKPPLNTDKKIIQSLQKIVASWNKVWLNKLSSDDEGTTKYIEAIHLIFVIGFPEGNKEKHWKKLRNTYQHFLCLNSASVDNRCEGTQKTLPEDLHVEFKLGIYEKISDVLEDRVDINLIEPPPVPNECDENLKKQFDEEFQTVIEALRKKVNIFGVLDRNKKEKDKKKPKELQGEISDLRKTHTEEVEKSKQFLKNIMKLVEGDLPFAEDKNPPQYDDALKTFEKQWHSLKSEIVSLETEMKRFRCQSNAEDKIRHLQKEHDAEVKTSMVKEHEDKSKRITEELSSGNDFKLRTVEGLLTALKNNTIITADINAELESYDENTRKGLRRWYQRVRKQLEGLLLEKDKTRQEIENLKQKQAELEENRETLLNRLSQIAGAKLKENNPNITDLSDPNRPLKIAEQFGELYDKEWTNTLEELVHAKMEETAAIDLLLESIGKCYQFCLRNSDQSLKMFLMCEDSDWRNGLNADENHMLSETRKSLAKVHIRQIKQKFLKEKMNEKKKQKNLINFVEKSLELCWYMVIQNPPIHMEVHFPTGAPLNKNTLKEYTISGDTISFLVWPPLYLHKDGPLLSKGVAQPIPKPNRRKHRESKERPSTAPR